MSKMYIDIQDIKLIYALGNIWQFSGDKWLSHHICAVNMCRPCKINKKLKFNMNQISFHSLRILMPKKKTVLVYNKKQLTKNFFVVKA